MPLLDVTWNTPIETGTPVEGQGGGGGVVDDRSLAGLTAALDVQEGIRGVPLSPPPKKKHEN